jgi:hypothetical protein
LQRQERVRLHRKQRVEGSNPSAPDQTFSGTYSQLQVAIQVP